MSDSISLHRELNGLHVLMEEVEQGVVSTLVLLLDLLILQVAASSHEAVDLVREPLDNVLGLNVLLPRFDVVLALILGWEHRKRNGNASCVVRINHGWVASGGHLPWSALLRGEVHDLAAPAKANYTPLLDIRALGLDLLQDLGNTLEGLRWSCSCREEPGEEC